MMSPNIRPYNHGRKLVLAGLLAMLLFAANGWADEANVSGRLVNGYRELPMDANASQADLTVYRGDYIRFVLPAASTAPLLSIPELGIEQKLDPQAPTPPYFKMKKPGVFAYRLGNTRGRITVVEYRQPSYREVTARQASVLIRESAPLVLDVRTPREYRQGHLQNALLIPVQALQKRLDEISRFRNQEVLVYCATGNRSTVAAKIMIDGGFRNIVNMRRGIVDWAHRKYPLQK